MKKISLFAIISALMLCSCGGGGGDDPEEGGYSTNNVLNVSPSSLTFSSDQTTSQTFKISTRNVPNWKVTNTFSWVHVTPTEGSGDAIITVTVDKNTSGSSRTASILVTGSNLSKEVTITQSAPTDDIRVTPTSITFKVEGETRSLVINCDLTWNITSYPKEWCKLSSASGNGDTTIDVTATSNETGTQRSGNIVIQGTTSTVTIPVSQEAGTAPTVTNFSISASGNYSFNVSALPSATSYGVCYSTTNKTPTTDDTKESVSGLISSGNVEGTVDNLQSSVTYYFRAFATNAVGTTYSSNVVEITPTNDTPGQDDNIPPSTGK